MRILATVIIMAAAALLFSCGFERPLTQAELLIGQWDQVGSVTVSQDGQEVTISDGEGEYRTDGTSLGEVTVTVAGLPKNLNSYKIISETSYILENNMLRETIIGAQVRAVGNTQEAAQVAALIQTSLMQTPSSQTIILTLNKDTLVVKEIKTGAEVTYRR